MKKLKSKVLSIIILSLITINFSCIQRDHIYEMKEEKYFTEEENNSITEKENKKNEAEKDKKYSLFSFLEKPYLEFCKYFKICQPKEEDLDKEF